MGSETEHLINEVRLLYQSLIQIGEQIHEGSNISMGMRAVLEYLEREGASSVPHMARARRVTRQRIQTLVNALMDQGLAIAIDNPASKRSPLIDLTDRGANTILDMRRRESRALKVPLGNAEIAAAAKTLANFRAALEARR